MARENYTPARLRPYSIGICGFGDSKTVGTGSTDNNAWYTYVPTATNNRAIRYQTTPKVARPGFTAALWRENNRLVNELAPITEKPDFVLCNLGVNDVGPANPPLEPATWQSDFGYCLDLLNAKWPTARVLVANVWLRYHNGQLAALNDTWIPAVLSTRAAWASVAIDERIFLENGDNGETYTTDTIHPNDAGYRLTWQQWLGYL